MYRPPRELNGKKPPGRRPHIREAWVALALIAAILVLLTVMWYR